MRYLLALLSLLAMPAHAQQSDCGKLPDGWNGQVHAVDGATLGMIVSGQRTPDIRLWGIRAPDLLDRATGLENLAGVQAKEGLSHILRIGGRTAYCRPKEWDGGCRVAAGCLSTGATHTADIGLSLVASGFAYVDVAAALKGDRAYAQHLLDAEQTARTSKRGLWRHGVAPMER